MQDNNLNDILANSNLTMMISNNAEYKGQNMMSSQGNDSRKMGLDTLNNLSLPNAYNLPQMNQN